MTEAADQIDLAHHAASGVLRAIVPQLERTATLNTGRAARLHLDQGGGRQIDRPVRRTARQLGGHLFGALHRLAEGPRLLASLAAGTVAHGDRYGQWSAIGGSARHQAVVDTDGSVGSIGSPNRGVSNRTPRARAASSSVSAGSDQAW